MNQKVAAYLGFAQKARKIVGGDSAAKAALNQGKGKLVILATDASERTAGDFTKMVETSNIPIVVMGTKSELGLAIGQSPRSVLVVKDEGFAKAIWEAHHGQVRDLNIEKQR